MDKYQKFSSEYPTFVYQDYSYHVEHGRCEGSFIYTILNKNGKTKYELKTEFAIDYIGAEKEANADLDALVYNLGMVEAISYWKLTCAPTIEIKCGYLNHFQKKWWRKLFKKGLSEFFYLNDIHDWDEESLQFKVVDRTHIPPLARRYREDIVIVPIGGGKDSITTVEILRKEKDIVPLVMNPIRASKEYIEYRGYDSYIHIHRKLDPQIIQLNAQGFLNGHIPFSAVLSFYTMTAARMYGIKDIALSNESSANEPTILGTDINHQYSKSLEYETDINMYAEKCLDPDINYFSMLRPLNEYQITNLFSDVELDVLKMFRSCNVGSKKGIWCTKCPKCLFTYIMLHAHLTLETMVTIFGHDLLDDMDLSGYFLSLTGQRTEKPFECVGTIEEVNTALQVIKEKRRNNLPRLYEHWDDSLVVRTADSLILAFERSRLTSDYAAILSKSMTYAL